MSDELDLTAEREQVIADAKLLVISNAARVIPVGVPGECEKCGEDSPRLVGGACAPCRDKYKLP